MAINTLSFMQNMPDPGQAFAQAFQQAQQQRKEQSRKEQYQQAVQGLMKDYSPPAMARFSLMFPEQAKAMQDVFGNLSAEQKKSRFQQSSQVLTMLEAGDTEGAKAYANQVLTAAKNTPGQQEYAQGLEYGLKLLDKNPEAAKAALAQNTYHLDPDGYKTLYATGKGEMTGFQKDLIAAGVDPTSDEGKAKAKEYVSLKVDPIVQMPTPDGAQFIGRQSEYNRRFGGSSSPTSNMPSPMTKAQYDALAPGTEYYDPRDKQVKRKSGKGGASSNASGGF